MDAPVGAMGVWAVSTAAFSRRVLTSGGCVLVLAALAAPSTAFSQRAAERQRQIEAADERLADGAGGMPQRDQSASAEQLEPDERRRLVEDLERAIDDARLAGGSNSPDAIEPLAGLGRFYQQSGQHLRAISLTQQALNVLRYNYGLHSLDQAPLLRQMMQSVAAIGSPTETWNLEQQLLGLAERHPDDLRSARILREVADRRMDVLRRYIAGEYPPEIVLGCYYEPPDGSVQAGLDQAQGQVRQCRAGSKREAQRRLLLEARSFYAQAVRIFLRNEEYADPELQELEMGLVRASYAFGGGEGGKESLRRLLSYQVANSAPLLARIDTLVQMADWDLLYSHRWRTTSYADSALEVYEQAYRQLLENGIAQASIDAIFAPSMPITIPIFEPNQLDIDETAESIGHIDVAFDVTRDGRGERVEIIDATENATRAVRRDLVGLIERTSFRPRSTDGRFDDSRVVVRYYLTD